MAQTKIPVQAVQVDYVCDECGEGKMRMLNTQLLTYPPQYPHRCTYCYAEKTFRVGYPYIEYVEVAA